MFGQQVPSIASNGVVSAASFQAGIVPNSWVTIKGTNLSSVTATWDKSIVNGNLPTTLQGVSVRMGGKPAYVAYVSPRQINVVAPDIGPGSTSVTVTNSAGTSPAATATASTFGPAFFLWAGKYAVATHQDLSWAAKDGTIQGVNTMPTKPGEVIILWGTGFGPTNPPAPAGVRVPSDRTYSTATPVSVTVGGTSTQVYGTALSPGFAGLYQVAIQIPPSAPTSDLPVVAAVNGVQSPGEVFITVVDADPAEIITPEAGSILPGSTVSFRWTPGRNVAQYYLRVGTKQGRGDVYESDQGSAIAVTVSGVPTDGGPIYVQLSSRTGEIWTAKYYTYTAAGDAVVPVGGYWRGTIVSFWVAADGSKIARPGPEYAGSMVLSEPLSPTTTTYHIIYADIPIRFGRFEYADTYATVIGRFTSPRRASGTLKTWEQRTWEASPP